MHIYAPEAPNCGSQQRHHVHLEALDEAKHPRLEDDPIASVPSPWPDGMPTSDKAAAIAQETPCETSGG